MKTQEVVLSQEKMSEAITNFIIKFYIKNGSFEVTPAMIKEKLGINVSKSILSDKLTSIRCGLIELEIQAQCELVNQHDFTKFYKKVGRKITSFDFSKYVDMNIDKLRTYLLVFNEETSDTIRGENLIEKRVDRACVGIFSLLKGGTYIEMDRSLNIIKQIEDLKCRGYLNNEQKRNIIEALDLFSS